MWKWALIAVGLVGALLYVLAEAGGDKKNPQIEVPLVAPPRPVQVPAPVANATRTAPEPRAVASPKVPEAAASDSDEKTLDPQSNAFSKVLDEGIPDTFRAALAKCERKGMDPDAKITLSYELQIEEGRVSASNVQVDRSTLENSVLEQCMVTALQSTKWIDKTLPDFSEDQDVFLRIRSLDKYLGPEEQKASKAARRTLNASQP